MKDIMSWAFCTLAALAVCTNPFTGVLPAHADEDLRVFPLPGDFAELRIADDGATLLAIDRGRSMVAVTMRDTGETNTLTLEQSQIVDAFFWSDLILVLARDRSNSNEPGGIPGRVVLLQTDGSVVEDQFLDIDTGDEAALLPSGELYVLDGYRETISMVPLCRDLFPSLPACELAGSRGAKVPSGSEEAYAEFFALYAGRVIDFTADPYSNLLIVSSPAQLTGFDLRFEKILFELFVSKEPLDPRIIPDISADATRFFIASDFSDVTFYELNRDFREPVQEARISIAAGTEADIGLAEVLESVAGYAPGAGSSEADPARRIATSQDQKTVVLAEKAQGRHGLFVLTRKGRSFVQTFAISLDAGVSPNDFVVSKNGAELALLFDDAIAILPISELGGPSEDGPLTPGLPLEALLQTRLSEAGYYRGVADGAWGPLSQEALDRFCLAAAGRACRASSPERTEPDILARLLTGRLDHWDRSDAPPDLVREVNRRAFQHFFDDVFPNSPHFRAGEFYMLGHDRYAAPGCLKENDYPPESLWPNILPALSDLQRIRTATGEPIIVNATYQTQTFIDCQGRTAAADLHGSFSAIDFRFDNADGASIPDTVLKALKDPEVIRWSEIRRSDTGFVLAFPPERLPEIGEVQAVIASYEPTVRGCEAAKDDVREFSRLLAKSRLSGRDIAVLRTRISNNYAVSVDLAGDDMPADEARIAIRNAALRSADRGTGLKIFKKTNMDTFIQTNLAWFTDPDCAERRQIP